MATAFWLRVDGVWLSLPRVRNRVEVKKSRPSGALTTSGGIVYLQRAKRSARTWDLDFTNRDVETVRWLQHAASGLATEVWLLDRAAAQRNMLAPAATVGRSAAQPTVAVDGIPMRCFAAAEANTHPVRGGIAHTLSYTTSHTAGQVIGTYNTGAGAQNIVAPTGTGARRGTVTFTPPADGNVVITWTVTGKTSGVRLTEGNVDTIGFVPGTRTPCRVAVMDEDQTLSMVYDTTAPISDFSVTIMEVG